MTYTVFPGQLLANSCMGAWVSRKVCSKLRLYGYTYRNQACIPPLILGHKPTTQTLSQLSSLSREHVNTYFLRAVPCFVLYELMWLLL